LIERGRKDSPQPDRQFRAANDLLEMHQFLAQIQRAAEVDRRNSCRNCALLVPAYTLKPKSSM
jgi:hypothetical protein